MKVTRQFIFKPRWNSRGFSSESTRDMYPLPGFNEIAKILNDKGWEIKKFEIIPDEGVYGYQKTDDMNGLTLYCEKESSVFIEEPGYYYQMSGLHEIEIFPYYVPGKELLNKEE